MDTIGKELLLLVQPCVVTIVCLPLHAVGPCRQGSKGSGFRLSPFERRILPNATMGWTSTGWFALVREVLLMMQPSFQPLAVGRHVPWSLN